MISKDSPFTPLTGASLSAEIKPNTGFLSTAINSSINRLSRRSRASRLSNTVGINMDSRRLIEQNFVTQTLEMCARPRAKILARIQKVGHEEDDPLRGVDDHTVGMDQTGSIPVVSLPPSRGCLPTKIYMQGDRYTGHVHNTAYPLYSLYREYLWYLGRGSA